MLSVGKAFYYQHILRGRGMNRDETVALFLECEDRRQHARATATTSGDESEKETRADEVARDHWNAHVGFNANFSRLHFLLKSPDEAPTESRIGLQMWL